MSESERNQIRQSIIEAKDALQRGLLQPEDASQLRRMIVYYEELLEKDEQAE